MSEEETKSATATAEKPAAEEKAAEPEKPFTVDVFQSCTKRITRKAWDLYKSFCANKFEKFRTIQVRGQLECHSVEGAEELQAKLVEVGVKEISRKEETLHFTATMEQIQTVIKLPPAKLLDMAEL